MYGCSPKPQEQEFGEFDLPFAYVTGSKHAHYGSEKSWDRRFFTDQLDQYGRRGQKQMQFQIMSIGNEEVGSLVLRLSEISH